MSRKCSKSNCNRPLPGALMGFAKMTLTELETPRSLMSAELLTSRKFGDVILQEPVRASEYNSPNEFKREYLAAEMLSKFPIDIGIDRDKVAIDSFEVAESVCATTNLTFQPGAVQKWPFRVRSIMEMARIKIEKVLGPFDWDEVSVGFGFGPGASSSLSRRNASTERKLQYGIASTAGAALAALSVWEHNKGWKSALDEAHTTRPHIVRGSRLVTVPKNAKTSRVIAIEPDLNIYLQKGLGRVIRKRLRKHGLDLNTAWRENHELAKIGSAFNSTATIDLKMASDTISYKLVEWLLPPVWFEALCLARSRKTRLPCGDWVSLHKFSSMGNGFTFELESLIFWALCSAVVSSQGSVDRISVFGDDLIVPVSAYDEVCLILTHCGFTVNESKTFRDGPFRESCGKHFFEGYDVTPFYLRKEESDILTTIHALNRAREWSIHPVYGLDGLKHTYESTRERLPAKYRYPTIPYGYGDGALWGEFDESRPQKAPDGKEGWICQTLLPVSLAVKGTSRFSVLAGLYKMEVPNPNKGWFSTHHGSQFVRDVDKELSFSKPPSAFAERWKRGRVLVTQWPHFGPWL